MYVVQYVYSYISPVFFRPSSALTPVVTVAVVIYMTFFVAKYIIIKCIFLGGCADSRISRKEKRLPKAPKPRKPNAPTGWFRLNAQNCVPD